jgi:hypothetical protein
MGNSISKSNSTGLCFTCDKPSPRGRWCSAQCESAHRQQATEIVDLIGQLYPPGERTKELMAAVHRAEVATRRERFKLIKGGKHDQPKLKSEFKL